VVDLARGEQQVEEVALPERRAERLEEVGARGAAGERLLEGGAGGEPVADPLELVVAKQGNLLASSS